MKKYNTANRFLTTEEFIEKARKIHGTQYDYSLVKYIDSKTKVQIICPIHGVFEQAPTSHIYSGAKCKKCARIQAIRNIKLTTEEFIEKARKIHGNKYDYSKSIYTGINEKIIIICPQHGEIVTTPDKHLRLSGCKLCGYESSAKKRQGQVRKHFFIKKIIGN